MSVSQMTLTYLFRKHLGLAFLCVYVCVCERERERERQRPTETEKKEILRFTFGSSLIIFWGMFLSPRMIIWFVASFW